MVFGVSANANSKTQTWLHTNCIGLLIISLIPWWMTNSPLRWSWNSENRKATLLTELAAFSPLAGSQLESSASPSFKRNCNHLTSALQVRSCNGKKATQFRKFPLPRLRNQISGRQLKAREVSGMERNRGLEFSGAWTTSSSSCNPRPKRQCTW